MTRRVVVSGWLRRSTHRPPMEGDTLMSCTRHGKRSCRDCIDFPDRQTVTIRRNPRPVPETPADVADYVHGEISAAAAATWPRASLGPWPVVEVGHRLRASAPDQWGALCRCGVPDCARRLEHDVTLVRRTRPRLWWLRWRWTR